jgi:hypothetical protein
MTDQTIIQDVAEIRQRVQRIEGALLRVLNLVEPMILDRDKAHVNLSKPASRSHRNVTDQ